MANVSSATIVDSWTVRAAEDGVIPIVSKLVEVVLSTQGGATNLIPASVLGLRRILSVTTAMKTDNAKLYPAGPSLAGTEVLVNDVATNAAALTVGDISATVRFTVTGYPTETVS